MSENVLPFLIYWAVFWVACLGVMELFQDWFYDEVTPHSLWKAMGGSCLLAAAATYFRPSFETLFTSNLAWTLLQAIIWFGVFTLILQFHPMHALGVGLVTMVLISGLATLGVDSLTKPKVVRAPTARQTNEPLRKSLGPATATPAAK